MCCFSPLHYDKHKEKGGTGVMEVTCLGVLVFGSYLFRFQFENNFQFPFPPFALQLIVTLERQI